MSKGLELELLGIARQVGAISEMSGPYSYRLAQYIEREGGEDLQDMTVRELLHLIGEWRAKEGLGS